MTEQITVSGSVGSLDSAQFVSHTGIRRAIINVQGGNVRYYLDGTNPTTAIGLVAVIGDVIELESLNELRGFRALNITDPTVLEVQYQ